jgi:tetratricopeptide (TPR) repeat protein
LYYYKNNDKKTFLEYYKRAIELEPKYILAWYNLSIFYKKEKKLQKEKICKNIWKTIETKKINNKNLNLKEKNIIKLLKFKKEIFKFLEL